MCDIDPASAKKKKAFGFLPLLLLKFQECDLTRKASRFSPSGCPPVRSARQGSTSMGPGLVAKYGVG